MPVDMVLIISYRRICESAQRFEKIVNKKSKYNDVNNVVENRKQNSCLEMIRLW